MAKIADCTDCRLHSCRTQNVQKWVRGSKTMYPVTVTPVWATALRPGLYDIKDCEVLVILDNPSLLEAQNRQVFEAKSDYATMETAIKESGLDLTNVAFTWATRCPWDRSDSDTTPGKTEIVACQKWLLAELKYIAPKVKVIVCLGRPGTAAVMGCAPSTAGKFRGKVHSVTIDEKTYKVISTVHIAQAIHSATDAETLAFDLALARLNLDSDFTGFDMDAHKAKYAEGYKLLKTVAEVREAVDTMLAAPIVVFDTETRGLEPWHLPEGPGKFLTSIQFAYDDGKAFFLPLSHKDTPWSDEEYEEVKSEAVRFFTGYTGILGAFNAKFDQVGIVHGLGVCPKVTTDVMLLDLLVRGLPARSLKRLAWEVSPFGGYEETLRGYGKSLGKQEHDSYLYDMDKLFWYGCLDVHVTWLGVMALYPQTLENEDYQFLNDYLARASGALAEIEVHGWKISNTYLHEYREQLEREKQEFLAKMKEDYAFELDLLNKALDGAEFVPTNPAHTKKLLKDVMQLASGKTTKKGAESFDREALAALSADAPIVDLILEYRKRDKMSSTFCAKWEKAQSDSRIHFRYNLINNYDSDSENKLGTDTGRLSSSGYAGNCQAIKKDPVLRKVFIPDDDESVIVDLDYKTLEYVIFAKHSAEPKLCQYLSEGYDVHAAVAAELFHSTPEEMMKEENKPFRQKAKTLNFAILFGASAKRVAMYLKITEEEAQEFMNSYLEKFPGIRNWQYEQETLVKQQGFCVSKLGRKRLLPDALLDESIWKNRPKIDGAVRRAINTPVQGDASDVCLFGLCAIHEWLKSTGKKSRVLATIHDAIILSVRVDEFEEVVKKAIDTLENPALPQLSRPGMGQAPLRVDGTAGVTWGDAVKIVLEDAHVK